MDDLDYLAQIIRQAQAETTEARKVTRDIYPKLFELLDGARAKLAAAARMTERRINTRRRAR